MSTPTAPVPVPPQPGPGGADAAAPGSAPPWREPLAASTRRFLDAARGLDGAAVRAPSLLPGWTRGHVLAHVARNADGMVNLVRWAATGEETPMYADRATRDADIERGAGRPLAEHLADLEASAARLDAALQDLRGPALDAVVRTSSGTELPGRDLPWGRRRELEVHLVDLDVGTTPAHWPEDFVLRTLDDLAPLFRHARETPVRALRSAPAGPSWEVGARGPDLHGPPSALLAWLTGRSSGDGLRPDPDGPVPPAPRWA
ncbi:maleylpyruvate isomerase family mycothiol-dependent enzyme [Vallicoccus soli]|uniref:maleylpyruvate isomerase family mycothiol-dependent enzyme n=1 Tax=Vallicoccus soli TaxID=2339232 RepID=UPI001403F851|nr:maleylpyruvate isomerase family mycothiol-dependent enzyme [Vallicoccus soli]